MTLSTKLFILCTLLYHRSASHSLKHGLADALKYILEWAAAVCTAHLSVQLVQSLADAIEYNWEWTAAVCTAVHSPYLVWSRLPTDKAPL